jgi:hypothetical protein
MTQSTGRSESLSDRPKPREVREVGDVANGQRWNGATWEPAGTEGVASVPAPRHHHGAAAAVTHPGR